MQRRLTLCLTLALLVVVLSPPQPARLQGYEAIQPLPPVASRDPRFGIVQALQSPSLASAAGATWERIIFPWTVMEREPGKIGPGYFSDDRIRAEVARGFTVVGLLIYTPDWAAPNPRAPHPKYVPRNLYRTWNDPDNYWGRFVWAVAHRYQGIVNQWIVWNEMDIYDPAGRYSFDGSFEDYFQLVKVAYQAAKAANPKARVMLGGMAYWLDQTYGRPPYLASLLEVAKRDPLARLNGYFFDGVIVHTYANPLNSYAVPTVMRRIMRERGFDKPIWIGESNVVPGDDTLAPTPPGSFRASMEEQADYIIQSFALGIAAGVERQGVYKMIDEQPENGQWFGLVRNDGSVRPAYVAYQVAAKYMAGAKWAFYAWNGSSSPPTDEEITGLLDSDRNRTQFQWPGDINRVVIERGPRLTTVVWNSSGVPVRGRIPAAAPYAVAVTPAGQVGQFVARNGFYEIDLDPSHHNADPNDRSVNLIGGRPWILEENVTPLPGTVRTEIESVWPHGNAPVEQATQADIVGDLLLPDRSAPAPCRWEPRVQLWAAQNGGDRRVIATGRKDWVLRDGRRDPVWRFDNIDVRAARSFMNWLEFTITVDGYPSSAQPWVYRAPPPPLQPEPAPAGQTALATAPITSPTPGPEQVAPPGPPATDTSVPFSLPAGCA
ncbi:MAG: hypothetical protein IT307_20540 [Chloroflexi bacterium]|nr:hypothetical protein [Chloroflexota bacterium]